MRFVATKTPEQQSCLTLHRRILQGTKPSELPVQLPVKVQLTIFC